MKDIEFIHYRSMKLVLTTGMAWRDQLDSRGGVTVCYIKKDNGLASIGLAICSPQDNYCKKTGREIAEHRARSTHNSRMFSIDPIASYRDLVEKTREIAASEYHRVLANKARKAGISRYVNITVSLATNAEINGLAPRNAASAT